jgi:tetratricopeptide (TPR) repeat protein
LVGLAGLARLSGRLDEAAKRLDAAAKSAPDHEGVLLDRARLARSKGDLKGAIALCEQAAQRHRGLAEAYRLIAEIQLDRAKATKDEAEKKSLLEAAIEPADRAVALNDQDVESWECRSKVRAGLGAAEKDDAKRKDLREKALADIEAAIKLDPKEPRLYEERASRHYDIFVQDFDAGAKIDAYHEDYEQILRLQPEHPYALSSRG